MSELVPHKKTIDRPGKLREYRPLPKLLDFAEGSRPVKVSLANGKQGRGTCLGCHDAPCMMLGLSNTTVPETLAEFPGDPGREVCPTRAISWNNAREAVVVNADSCIGCGLCAVRCPYGAISFTDKGKAVVESADPDGLTVACNHREEFAEHAKPKRKGRLGSGSVSILREMPDSIARLSDIVSSQFVRNLLIECGIECRTRRRGDTNMRMDGVVGFTDGRLGVLEIELANSVLDSPRALLEDVAVLHGRYGIEVERIDPLSVILSLPNARSEYYQVIADIEKVLAIRCRTLTVGVLLVLLWKFRTIDGFPGDLFMTSPRDTNLGSSVERLARGAIPLVEPYGGTYKPFK